MTLLNLPAANTLQWGMVRDLLCVSQAVGGPTLRPDMHRLLMLVCCPSVHISKTEQGGP